MNIEKVIESIAFEDLKLRKTSLLILFCLEIQDKRRVMLISMIQSNPIPILISDGLHIQPIKAYNLLRRPSRRLVVGNDKDISDHHHIDLFDGIVLL